MLPRNFKLLEEYDEMKSGKISNISCGLVDEEDMSMTNWEAIIFSEKSDNVLKFHITCGPDYPQKSPTVELIIGHKNIARYFKNNIMVITKWKPSMGISDILIFLRDHSNC